MLRKLYEDEEEFASEFSGSVFFCFVAAIAVLIAIGGIYAIFNVKQIVQDWPNQKCKPYVIPFAGYLNKPANQSVYQFTEENFMYCQQNIFKTLITKFLSPLHSLVESVGDLFKDVSIELQSMRIAMANLRTHLMNIFSSCLSAIEAVIVPLQQIFIVAKDSIAKASAIVMTGLYIVLGVIETLKSALTIFFDFAIVILIILAALIISLFAGTFTIPIAIIGLAIFLSIAKPFRTIIDFFENVLNIKPSKTMPNDPNFCFSASTVINDKSVKDYQVDDEWPYGGGKITAKLKLKSSWRTIFYHPVSNPEILITGRHRVLYNKSWIFVKDHPDFIESSLRSNEEVYCFCTETKYLPIQNYVLLDWDELDPFDFDTTTVNDVDGIVYLSDNKVVILSATTN
jgi:hypothetical protein